MTGIESLAGSVLLLAIVFMGLYMMSRPVAIILGIIFLVHLVGQVFPGGAGGNQLTNATNSVAGLLVTLGLLWLFLRLLVRRRK